VPTPSTIRSANAGTTGPTLRGAIQTNVNGGNITDARLSGTGVTASNYNAGARRRQQRQPGRDLHRRQAGALAPLSGQVLNLRSNFDNIADQKLNIVLAGGAAAYNAAIGNAAPAPVTVANQRVGGTTTAALTISNQAAVGAFSEDLIASFGSNGGQAQNNGGNVSGLLAGASNGSAMRVGVDTSAGRQDRHGDDQLPDRGRRQRREQWPGRGRRQCAAADRRQRQCLPGCGRPTG
jgi:hypothetical protein